MITKLLKRFIVSTPLGHELDNFLPYGVIVYSYEKNGRVAKGIIKKERINKVQILPEFTILKECLNTEVGHNYSFSRMSSTASAVSKSKEWHAAGGKKSSENGKASIRIKKVYEKFPVEMREVNLENGKNLLTWRKENPEQVKINAGIGGKSGGKITGKLNVESGHWQRVSAIGRSNFLNSPMHREWCIQGGKAAASNPANVAKFIENRDPAAGGRIGGKTTQSIVRECPHCNKSCKGSGYFTWHGDKCKKKPA